MESRQRRGASSFRYRKIAPSSTADETLFKSCSYPIDRRSLYITGKDTPIRISDIFDSKESSDEALRNSARITLEDISEIERLKDLDTSRAHLRPQNVEEDMEERIQKSNELRNRLLRFDSERRKRDIFERDPSNSPSNTVLGRAQEANEESREEVRAMNNIILKCKVDAIRSRQIQLKREAAEERERLQKELDEMMEEERIKRVKEIDERDALRLQRLKMQETMIRQQIAERQLKRELELEERERERALVLKQMEALKVQDALTKKQKEEAARNLRLEVNAHNELILKENSIRQPNLMRLEPEGASVTLSCPRQFITLPFLQEYYPQEAAVIGAMEERERVERQREEAEAARQRKINDELAKARMEQHREKMLKLVETAVAEKKEFDRVAATQRELAAAEQAKREAEKAKRIQHMAELRRQIEERSKEIEKLKKKQLAEAEALRLAEEEDQRAIERARERKLAELQQLSDAEKYIAQLRKVCAK
ncbi:Coiled-coil domain-containing protein 19 mitochondrial, related [Eimeria maxima]|uniref:Cilia- and flagella-associated protein 45 n=1 Tax=Eimeria maxima TaxID=5804 RepID=U6MCG7_EIMMA|nr:Coiled-coil domain-containing protein 19 mitochondrial, related [Eimeria maxima]CDJ60139.1 Coiled-coil domain-containing protein 19 mitochondrial, related [Eimeria maxima]